MITTTLVTFKQLHNLPAEQQALIRRRILEYRPTGCIIQVIPDEHDELTRILSEV